MGVRRRKIYNGKDVGNGGRLMTAAMLFSLHSPQHWQKELHLLCKINMGGGVQGKKMIVAGFGKEERTAVEEIRARARGWMNRKGDQYEKKI